MQHAEYSSTSMCYPNIHGRAKLKIFTKVPSKIDTSCGEKYSLENSHSIAVKKIQNSHVIFSPVFYVFNPVSRCYAIKTGIFLQIYAYCSMNIDFFWGY
jgi:hypothetical protein